MLQVVCKTCILKDTFLRVNIITVFNMSSLFYYPIKNLENKIASYNLKEFWIKPNDYGRLKLNVIASVSDPYMTGMMGDGVLPSLNAV